MPQTDLLERLPDVDVVLGVGLLHRVVELKFELDDLLSQIEPLLLAATPRCVLFLLEVTTVTRRFLMIAPCIKSP